MLVSGVALSGLALSGLAQGQTQPSAVGCGDPSVLYDVQTDHGLHPAPISKTRALVFFLEDDSAVSGFHKPMVREGVDGKWVAATEGTSYTFVYLAPGPHQFCSLWQDSEIFSRKVHPMASLALTLEAGRVYFITITNGFHGASRLTTQMATITTANQEDLLADYAYAYSRVLPQP